MTSILSTLKQKKWSILFISFILLFNNFFLYFTNNFDIERLLFVYTSSLFAVFIFSILCLFLKQKREKIYLLLLFLISLIPNLIIFSYAIISDTHIRGDMYWVIFESNTTESLEFIKAFYSWKIIGGILFYLSASIFLFWKSGSSTCLSLKQHKILFAIPFISIFFLICFEFGTRGIGFLDFYKNMYIYYHDEAKAKKQAEFRSNIKTAIDCQLPDSTNHTFIFILGESIAKNHMGIYGYNRNTTPCLNAMQNELDIYTNIISPETYTVPSLRKVLTFASHQFPGYEYKLPSIVKLFNDAGFETYWISNQVLRKRSVNGYDAIAGESKNIYRLSIHQQPDGIILPVLNEILEKKEVKNKMIFIHIMGGHVLYSSRYPSTFNHFDYKKDTIPYKPFLTDKHKQTIDEYDNAIRYNDYFVSSVINAVKSKNQSSFVVFFPDHGEEVYDFRDFKGHEIENSSIYQCEIPFILWLSDKYKKEVPCLVIDKKRPFSTENFIYSISTLAALKYDFYVPEFSLFSEKFIPQKRFVGKMVYRDKGGN